MTIKYADRVQETSASSGSGDLVLDGAVAGFRTINVAFDNDFDGTGLDFDYVIKSDVNNTFEIGTGKLTTSTLMERTTVTQNSDEDTSKINFASGGLTITVTPSRDTLANIEVTSLVAGTADINGGSVDGAVIGASSEAEITGTVLNATAAVSASDPAAMGFSASQGLMLIGDGSVNDVVLRNNASSNVIRIPTGTINAAFDGHILKSVTTSITAGSTQTQAGATLLTTDINRVNNVGTNGDGAKLPVAVEGMVIIVQNRDGSETLKMWPNTGAQIDEGGANLEDPVQLSPNESRFYYALNSTNWYKLDFTV